MIVGIGTDLIKIARIAASLEKLGDRFARRILTEQEFVAFSGSALPASFLAKRFAAKEAAAKALGTGISQGVSWQHMAITHDEWGGPLLHFSDRAAELATLRGATTRHISLSDEKDYAVAFVVLSAG